VTISTGLLIQYNIIQYNTHQLDHPTTSPPRAGAWGGTTVPPHPRAATSIFLLSLSRSSSIELMVWRHHIRSWKRLTSCVYVSRPKHASAFLKHWTLKRRIKVIPSINWGYFRIGIFVIFKSDKHYMVQQLCMHYTLHVSSTHTNSKTNTISTNNRCNHMCRLDCRM